MSLPLALLLALLATLPAAAQAGAPVRSPWEAVPPASVGLSEARLQAMDREFQAHIDRGELAGCVSLVLRHGRVAHLEAQGWLDLEARKPMRADALFRIASMTKLVTSVAALMLCEEGRFALDDPVSNHLPAFRKPSVAVLGPGKERPLLRTEPARREITVRDLLTHTSGLTYGEGYGGLDRLWEAAALKPSEEPMARTVAKIARLPLAFHPGQRWNYGMSTLVLGHLVEVVSGMSLDRFFETRIFGPLKMVDTGFVVPQGKLERFSTLYRFDGGALRSVDAPGTSPWRRPRAAYSGDGPLVSTALDYARFLQMLLNGGELEGVRILGRRTVELMTRNQLEGLPREAWYKPDIGFGLGVAVAVDTREAIRPGSYWWAGINNTVCLVDPREGLVGVFMTQVLPFRHLGIMERFQRHCGMALDSPSPVPASQPPTKGQP